MGAKGLQSYALQSYGVEMSFEEASLYRRRFFETYPEPKRWHEREQQSWLCSETEAHPRRQTAGRCAKTDRLNAAAQGTGADSLKLTLALLWERGGECPEAVPLTVCHDEIVIECNAERAADAKAWLERAMIEEMVQS
jgi:DNA polymerase I